MYSSQTTESDILEMEPLRALQEILIYFKVKRCNHLLIPSFKNIY